MRIRVVDQGTGSHPPVRYLNKMSHLVRFGRLPMGGGIFLSHLALGKARDVFGAFDVGFRGKEQHCNRRNERRSTIRKVLPSHLTLVDSFFVSTVDVSNLDLVALVETATISTQEKALRVKNEGIQSRDTRR